MSEEGQEAMLLVGEGDFSFSVALQRHLDGADITTSCLLTEGDLYKRHIHSSTNVSLLREQGVTVLFEVDATSLASHVELHQRKFHKVVFNFPHVGGKSDIRRNRRLLKGFFLSAADAIHPNGSVCVTLCKGQGGTPMDQPIRLWADSWQVVAMATYADLVLHKVEPFDAHVYTAYSATGYRSQDRHFFTDGALTYIFRRSPPVQMPSMPFQQQMSEITADGMTFLTEAYVARKLNMDLLGRPTHPIAAVRAGLMTSLTGTFTSVKDVGPLPLVVSEKCCSAVTAEMTENGADSEMSNSEGGNESKQSYDLTPVEGDTEDDASNGEHTVQCKHTQKNLCAAMQTVSISCTHQVSPACPSCQSQHGSRPSNRLTLRTSLLQHVDRILGADSFQQGELCVTAGVVCRRTEIDPRSLPIQHEFIGVIRENGSIDEFINVLSQSLDRLFSDGSVVITVCKPDECEQLVDAGFVLSASYTSASARVSLPCNQVPELGKPDKKLAETVTDHVTCTLGYVRRLRTHQHPAFAFVLSLDSIAQVKFDLVDANVLWCEAPSSETEGRAPSVGEPSLFPPMWRHDIAFWEDPKQRCFDETKLHQLIREITDDTIKNVILMNVWTDPSTGKTSRCYREIYQSSVKAVSHDLAHSLQNAVRLTVAKQMNVELR